VLALAEPLIKGEESCRLQAYLDTRGIPTIAWGRADAAVHLGMTCTQAEADAWFDVKVAGILGQLDKVVPWWRGMSLPRQAVLIDMAYQMGVAGLLGFAHAIAAMKDGHWQGANDNMLASTWDCQTPGRAHVEAKIMLTGEMPPGFQATAA
jgi:lysozyme